MAWSPPKSTGLKNTTHLELQLLRLPPCKLVHEGHLLQEPCDSSSSDSSKCKDT